jgi:hypothetical protein
VCRAVDPNHSFRIKGDDLVALWSEGQIQQYCELLAAVGFVLNDRKTTISSSFGTFCEVSYRRVRHDTLVRESDFSLRSFVSNERLAPDQWRMLVRHGASLKRLNLLARISHREWLRLARRNRVDPYAPPALGGLGLPPKRLDALVSPGLSSLVRACHNGVPLFSERTFAGTTSDMFFRMFERTRWSVAGDRDFTVFYDNTVGTVLPRAAFVDACQGVGRFTRPTRRAIVRRLGRFAAYARKLAPEPFPTSYRTAYDVLDRLLAIPHPTVNAVGTVTLGDEYFRGWVSFGPLERVCAQHRLP